MNRELLFLNNWKQSINTYINTIQEFIDSTKKIGADYQLTKSNKPKIGFNPFVIASGLYYRENFHSDILREILDPKGLHKESSLFLFLLIDALNKSDKNIRISKTDYNNSQVLRENDKIDILIKSEESKHCIIIENKIYNARDMDRQIPRYYDQMKSKGYIVDRIIYIPLDQNKKPDKSNWTLADKEHVDNIVTIMPAFDPYHLDIVNAWLVPSLSLVSNFDAISVIKQYIQLIKFLNHNNMDKIILEKFYNSILNEDNRNSAKSIVEMMNDIPYYRTSRLEDFFKDNCFPFNNIKIGDAGLMFENFTYRNIYLKLEIWNKSENDNYTIIFWAPNNEDTDIKNLFPDIDLLKSFELDNNQVHKIKMVFSFDEEKEVKQLVTKLLKALSIKNAQ